MRKLLTVLLMVFLLVVGVNASEEITIFLDDNVVATDTPPILEDDRTMVPLRFIAEGIGAEVTWNQGEQEAKIIGDKHILTFKIGLNYYIIEDTEDEDTTYALARPLDVVPKIVDDRTMVPLRAIGEALELDVNWNQAEKQVHLYTPQYKETPSFSMQNVKEVPETIPLIIDGHPNKSRRPAIYEEGVWYLSKTDFELISRALQSPLEDIPWRRINGVKYGNLSVISEMLGIRWQETSDGITFNK